MRYAPEVVYYLRHTVARSKTGKKWSENIMQAQYQKKFGTECPRFRIDKYEAETSIPNADTVCLLADCFGVHPGVLFTASKEKLTDDQIRQMLEEEGVITLERPHIFEV